MPGLKNRNSYDIKFLQLHQDVANLSIHQQTMIEIQLQISEF